MSNILFQLAMAFLGSMGFGILFHVRGRLLVPASLGGLMCMGAYLAATHFLGECFAACVIASAIAALYSEILARRLKAPATLFTIPAVVPMIPGSSLYYTMSYAVRADWVQTHSYGMRTVRTALGIAVGISLVWALWVTLHNMIARWKKHA